jgi:uncharacterized protein YbbK (DUF523 family)
MSEDLTPRVLVSACLAGEPCRYDGRSNAHPAIVRLVEQGRAVLVCPEVLGGLPTPREPMELSGGRVLGATGAEATDAFHAGARMALVVALQNGCTHAILKARSPSCGVGQVYDGSFTRRLVPGDGILAALLKANGVAVCTEESLD